MKKYTLKEHFFELRFRLIKVISFFFVTFCLCYYYKNELLFILLKPLINVTQYKIHRIIYTGLTEAFVSYLKLSVFSSFLLTFPIICYQLYFFIEPGLKNREKNIILLVFVISPILFFSSSFILFYFVMPKSWQFFLSFETVDAVVPIVLEAKVSEYLTLVMQFIVAFGLAFQLPIVLVVLSILNVITTKSLKKKRRISIVINFILAAILTPPDIFSQIALALPLILLYEISIVMCNFIEKREKKYVGSKVD